MAEDVTFEMFREQWLSDVTAGAPSTTVLGHRFARKLILQWLDVDENTDDLIYCDGAGDGGIDIAFLRRAEEADAPGDAGVQSDAVEGDTWYLVQSKYGTAFQGSSTLLSEATKVFDTLTGARPNLSSLAQDLVERLRNFLGQASERDRLVLVFATETPLGQDQRRTLDDVLAIGRQRLGTVVDVDAVSIETIFQRVQEEASAPLVTLDITGSFTDCGQDLLVGPTPLLNLYDFLKAYSRQTGDLDGLYEKNVRRFLGNARKVNKAMRQTLQDSPELFGLYNNGITIVASNFQPLEAGKFRLHDPYIVNGCQTTRTIWEVCRQRLEAGGTGQSSTLAAWREKAARGVVVTKVVRVGTNGEAGLQQITRFTNSQNAVREKDFLALTSDFKRWADQMGREFGVYLEIQRGGWDSRLALQKQKPAITPQYTQHANAFDLLKVYGSGWLREAGTAFGKNAPFLPNGAIFRQIMDEGGIGEPFGVDDLYAAYRLEQAANSYHFGRGAREASRRQTRFLFYLIALDLLKDVVIRADPSAPATPKALTHAFLALARPENESAFNYLLDAAIQAVDEYLNPQSEDSVRNEPAFQRDFNSDLNGYLKWEKLGKDEDASPRLKTLLASCRRALGHKGIGQQQSPRDVITEAITMGVLSQGG